MLRYLCPSVVAFLFATAACGETVTYVRTVSTTNFLGWGQAGFYFPQFAATEIVGPKRTDDNMQFYVPNWLEFNFDPWDVQDTTFSIDQPDCFDNCSGKCVYTRGATAIGIPSSCQTAFQVCLAQRLTKRRKTTATTPSIGSI